MKRNEQPNEQGMSTGFSHSKDCSGVHVGAGCLKTSDIRGAIVALTSRMLDNPREGIYPTTQFYDSMEQYIRTFAADLLKEQVEMMREMQKDLVVDNWQEAKESFCNPRCHDSGKDEALASSIAQTEKRIAELMNEI